MALLSFEAAFRVCFVITTTQFKSWITCQLYWTTNFCWPAGCQLDRSFTWIHICFVGEDKEEKYFPVRCYCSIVVLQKRNYHSDTTKPLLKVLGSKCRPWT